MSETNIDTGLTAGKNSSLDLLPLHWLCSAVESSVNTPTAPTTADEEAKRRRIMSKLWGKGNKLSHKVRELDKCSMLNSSDSSTHLEPETEPSSLDYQKNNHQSHSSADDSSNSINTNKPFAVVKPIILVKAGLIVAQTSERTRVESEANSSVVQQTNQIKNAPTSVASKKKKSHKNSESKKKKSSRSASKERTRSHHRVSSTRHRRSLIVESVSDRGKFK